MQKRAIQSDVEGLGTPDQDTTVSEMGVDSNVTEDVSFCANEPAAITTSKRREARLSDIFFLCFVSGSGKGSLEL